MDERQERMLGSDACSRELIQKALAGDARSLETLTASVRVRVYSYLHRITLDEHRAEDLTQDTLLAVFKSLGTFTHVDRFWAWVFAIATNNARQYYRSAGVRRTVQMSSLDEAQVRLPSSASEGVINSLSIKELGDLTRQAMGQLKERDRMILALRFYEDMSHAQVADVLGCSEVTARVSFLRAKHSLRRELAGLGIGSSALLAALAAFGQLTVPSAASAAPVIVNGAAATEGAAKVLLSGKARAALVAIVLVLVLAGLWAMKSSTGSAPQSTAVHFVHFTVQSLSNESTGGDATGSRSKGAYEQWYHFPEGVGGPFLLRMQRWNPKQTEKLCWWIQDGSANYYVHTGEQRIYISSARLRSSSGAIRLLPTDPPDLCEFVRQVEGRDSQAMADGEGITYERDPATGLPRRRVDTRFEDLGDFVTTYDYGTQDLSLFDAPTGMPITDERDEMHKRGWAYFRVEGRLRNVDVKGAGRIPFVLDAARSHSPWLRLTVGGKTLAVDNGERAVIVDQHSGGVTTCAGGGLFAGFSSPWIGLHTLDWTRRFAAKHRMWFSTELHADKPEGCVTVIDRSSSTHLMTRYVIDLDNDLLKDVEYWEGQAGVFEEPLGRLRFTYLAHSENTGPEFDAPTASELASAGRPEEPRPFWPVQTMVGPAPSQPGKPATEPACPVALR